MKLPLSRTVNKLLRKDVAPLWSRQPTSLQIDTTTRRCDLNCVFCNPQNQFIKEHTDMPMSMIETVFSRVKESFNVGHVYPFLNSDPLLETRLPEIARLAKRTFGERTYVMVSTNGVRYNRRELLNDPNIDEVSFTISAATPETYLRVHRRPMFGQANRTLRWLTENKHSNLKIGVRYILLDLNLSDLALWKRLYSGYPQEIWAVHYGDSRRISGKYAAKEEHPVIRYYREKRVKHFVRGRYPCNCFHNLAVGVHGEVMQCCDLSYEHNWGNIEEVDLMEVWRKRLELGLNHEGCRSCSQKNPHWRMLFEKYVW